MQAFLKQQEPTEAPKASEAEIQLALVEQAQKEQKEQNLLDWYANQPRKIKRKVNSGNSYSDQLKAKFLAKMKHKLKTDDIRGD